MHTEKNGSETHLDKIEARAGSRNKVNRNALVGALVLVLIAFALILGFGFLGTHQSGADKASPDNVAVNEDAK